MNFLSYLILNKGSCEDWLHLHQHTQLCISHFKLLLKTVCFSKSFSEIQSIFIHFSGQEKKWPVSIYNFSQMSYLLIALEMYRSIVNSSLPEPKWWKHRTHRVFFNGIARIMHFVWNPSHGPLIRYVKLQAVHAPGMPGPAAPRDLNAPGISGTCATHNLTYLASGAWEWDLDSEVSALVEMIICQF